MIGNDVVDLELASRQSDWRRRGFLKKVFSLREQEIIHSSVAPDAAVWLLWTMKEAAYKAHQRKFMLPRSINWLSLECYIREISASRAKGYVEILNTIYLTSSNLTAGMVHSTAETEEAQISKFRVSRLPKKEMKKDFLHQLAGQLSLPLQEFNICKNSNGVPFLKYKNDLLPTCFSFSHHGKYSSFCLSLTNC